MVIKKNERSLLKQLIDRQKLLAYCEARKNWLVKEMQRLMGEAPPRKREFIKQRFKGRIREIREMKRLANQGNAAIDEAGERYWIESESWE